MLVPLHGSDELKIQQKGNTETRFFLSWISKILIRSKIGVAVPMSTSQINFSFGVQNH